MNNPPVTTYPKKPGFWDKGAGSYINPFNRAGGRAWPHVVLILILLLSGSVGGFLTARAVYSQKGGVMPGPLPSVQRLSGGVLPAEHSLIKYVVRIHNQGDSNSCVAQGASTVVEVINAERGHRMPMSAGFLWNQVNGGADSPVTYDSIMSVLVDEGDAPLSAFAADGLDSDYWLQPNSYAVGEAAKYRIASWIQVSAGDQYSIEYAIAHGIPVLFALNVLTSFYNTTGYSSMPYLDGQSGSFLFGHNLTIYGYDRSGVDILNSWGPGWGFAGRAHMSWQMLASEAYAVVIPTPRSFRVVPAKKPPHFTSAQVGKWNAYRKHHHRKLISFESPKGLSKVAQLWLKRGPNKAGAIVSKQTWHPRPHRGGFEETIFARETLFYWIHHPWVKWSSHTRIR